MLTEQKIKEARKLISKGVPEGEIKNQLKVEGYSEEDIKKIFTPHSYDMRSWFLISGTLVLVFGLFIFFTNRDKPLLFILLAVVLFYQYYKADQKIKKTLANTKD